MTVKLDLKNKLINGSFEYWQRNTTFAAIADATYTADRWIYSKTGTMVHTISRSTNVPSDAFGVYSLLATPTTAQASLLSTSLCTITQRMEGNVLRTIKGKKMVLKFRVKAFKTGVYCLALRNNANDRSLIKEYTVNASNTWETKTIRFTHDAAGTWLYDTGIGMRVTFTIASGSNFITTKDVWQNGNFLATSSQVNGVDSISNTFQIADVCLVEDNDGATRDPEFQLAGRDLFEELQLCQRYYEKSYEIGTNPGTVTNTGFTSGTAAVTSTAMVELSTAFKSMKRAVPTMSWYSNSSGAINAIRGSDASDKTVSSSTAPSTQNTGYPTVTANQSGILVFAHWTADAEL